MTPPQGKLSQEKLSENNPTKVKPEQTEQPKQKLQMERPEQMAQRHMHSLRLTTFFKDRIRYIVAYSVSVALTLLVVQLGLLENGTALRIENVSYLLLLSAAVLCVYFLVDYGRQRHLYKQMNQLLQKTGTLDDTLVLQGAVTAEQRAYQAILAKQYRHYTKELVQLRNEQQRHLTFVNQWVHQMKTPVAVIDLLLQQTKDVPSTEEMTVTFNSIAEEKEKLAHGLDMMLNTARLDSFSFDVKAESIDLVETLRAVVNEYKKACIRQSVFPKLQAPQETAVVQTDAKWIRLVFRQLLTNAIKYSKREQASKTLWIDVYRDAIGWHVRLKDEGVGIPPQDVPRLFDPFFTGENGRRYAESTGMGLYLAKQLCERLDHQLDIQSEVGVGTTVTVTFPGHRHLHQM